MMGITPTSSASRRAAERRAHLMRELVEVLLFVGIVFLAVSVTQSFAPADTSMQPALQPGEHVLVNKAAYFMSGPGRGEIALVANPQSPSDLLLRRIIGVPGDTVVVTATTVEVNGVALNESVYTGIPGGQPESPVIGKWTLQSGQYFVLADNRFGIGGAGSDSRYFGPVTRRNIVGRAEMVYWPFKDFHWINTYSGVYSQVPGR
ncbi:MAG TPA: signal peptidase I [Ktedonobacterales bacterium]